MKKLFILCLLAVSAFTLKAQDLTFEETLAYLNKAAKNEVSPIRYGGMITGAATGYPEVNSSTEMINYLKRALRSLGPSHVLLAVGTSKNGNFSLKIDDSQFSEFNLFKLNQGFFLFENNIVFSKEKWGITYLQFVNDKEASRFYKALQHISSFCKEEKDPFDN